MSNLLIGYSPSGKIINMSLGETGELQQGKYQNMGLSLLLLEGKETLINPHTHYILDGEVTERPASPVTRTDLTLLAVPEGSTLWINGESYEAEGEVELEFPLSGTYRLRVECFPYLDWTDEVVV